MSARFLRHDKRLSADVSSWAAQKACFKRKGEKKGVGGAGGAGGGLQVP